MVMEGIWRLLLDWGAGRLKSRAGEEAIGWAGGQADCWSLRFL